jgi:coiled-coil domain-containing protein 151
MPGVGGGGGGGGGGQRQITESDLEDLRNKFHLLEGDRKAYYEMSMHTMKSNKSLVAQLRGENKEVRRALASIQRERANLAKGGGSVDDEEEREMEREVNRMRNLCDKLTNKAAGRATTLEKQRNKVYELELEGRKPHEEDTPETRKIRVLENRLDKAMIKFNEAQSIRKTYEQIVKRLGEERIGFDNQLAAIERTLSAKQHDYEELLLLSGDANHARDMAQTELERVRNTYQRTKESRESNLRERHDVAQIKAGMNARLAEREKVRNDILSQAAGDMNENQEQNMKRSLALNRISSNKIREETREQKKKIDVFEDAFRQIKEATGVSDVNEVIQKIVSQEDTQNNLMELTKENQQKVEAQTEVRDQLRRRVEETKYSAPGGGHRRKMVDDHEENLGAAVAKLERTRLKYERIAKILINVKAGVAHLGEKIAPLREGAPAIQINDETILEVMYQCESMLVNALHISRSTGDDDMEDMAAETDLTGISDNDVMQTRPFNQRISLPVDEGMEGIEEVDGDNFEEIGEEEELTRVAIKKASEQLSSANDRRTKKRGKKKKKPSKGR